MSQDETPRDERDESAEAKDAPSSENHASGDVGQDGVALDARARRRRGEDASGDHDHDDASRKRLLLVVPLVTAAAAIVALVLVGMQDKGIYSKTVDQLAKEHDKFLNKPVRAEGNLVHGSLVKRDSPCEYRFTIEKNGTEMPVRFAKCIVPDTFRDVAGVDVGVTVEGELHADNTIEASQVLAKCPSKYEMRDRAATGEHAPHAAVQSMPPL